MSENLTITDHALQLLDILQTQDPAACADLVTHKVQVPDKIADHDDFICQTARGGKTHLSVLGLINSLLVKSDNAKVAAIIDDDGTVVGFTKRFVEQTPGVSPTTPTPPTNFPAPSPPPPVTPKN